MTGPVAPLAAGTTAGTVAATKPLTTPALPPKYADPLQNDTKLQDALNAAIAKYHSPSASWPVSMCIVALPDAAGGANGFASFRPDESHFTASLAKVAAMYAAHEFRKTMRDIAAELGANATTTNVIPQARAFLNPLIMAQAGPILAKAPPDKRNANPVTLANKLPKYDYMFKCVAGGSGVTVNFSDAYQGNLLQMISISSNGDARLCIHGLGYGYLSAALSSAGFFDPSNMGGLWLCGDYSSFKDYGALTINTINDQFCCEVATSRQLAKLFALLNAGATSGGSGPGPALNDAESCKDMFALLKSAADVPEVFVTRGTPPLGFTVPRGKLGVAGLKSGPQVCSESAFLVHAASSRQFIAAWQNFVHGNTGWGDGTTWEPISWVVRDTLDAYTKKP